MNNSYLIKIVSSIFIFLFIIVGGFSLITSRSNDIDTIPEEGVSIDLLSQAYISDLEDGLINLFGGLERLDAFSGDLFVFAKTGYEKYSRPKNKIVGFKVSRAVKTDGKIFIEGKFGATKHKVTAVVTLLKHGRITASITDDVTGLNIDALLPSNSVRNQYIGSLPVELPEYTVEYLDETDSFSVNVFNSTNNYSLAAKQLKLSLKIQDLSDEEVVFYGYNDNYVNNDY